MLRVVRKADFTPQEAPQLTPDQIYSQTKLADELIAVNTSAQTALDEALQNVAADITGEAAQFKLEALATKAWQDSVSKLEQPMLQQIVNYANLDEGVKALGVKSSMTMTNPDAIAMARKQAGDLAVQLNKEQNQVIRNLTALAVKSEMSVDELGRKLRDHIGLFDKWQKAVENRYAETYKSFIRQGFDKTTAQQLAQKASSDYHAKLLRNRCQMIARTEVLRAENDGRWLGWKQAVNEGYADPNSHKRWIVRPVGACETCMALNGQEIPYDQPFAFGQLMPPRHPNCRCTALLVPPPEGYTPDKPPADLLKPSGYNKNNVFEGNVGGALPTAAPDYAKPIAWNGQLDVGDLLFFDGMQGTDGYEIASITGSKVYYKTATGTSPINVGDLLARGKAVAIVPGVAKLAKVTIKPDSGAFAPIGAPVNAIAVNKITSVGVGDTLYTSTLKAGQSMTVLAVDVDGQRLKVMGTTGTTYWTPFNSSKNQYAIISSPSKVKTLIGLPADQVATPKPPVKTIAGDSPAFKPYVAEKGDIVALTNDTSTYRVVKVTANKIELDNGAVVPKSQVIGLPAGAKVMTADSVVHAIAKVSFMTATLEDGQIVSLSSLKPAKNFHVVGQKPPVAVETPVKPVTTPQKPQTKPKISENVTVTKPEVVMPVMTKLGGIVTHTLFTGNTYTIIEVLPGNKFMIETATGEKFEASSHDLGAVGKGSVIKTDGAKLQVMEVEATAAGDFNLTFSDESTMKLSTLMRKFGDSSASIANQAGTPALFTGKFKSAKPTAFTTVPLKDSDGVPYSHAEGALTFATDAAGVQWGKKFSASWQNSLTYEEKSAIHAYTGASYREIDKHLRGKGSTHDPNLSADTDTNDRIRNVVAAIKKSIVKEDVIVSRALKPQQAVFETYKKLSEGALIYDSAFQSTSVGTKAAFSDGNVILRIRVKKGQQAGFVANLSQYEAERELLIQAGTTMKVNKVTMDSQNRAVIDVTIIDQKPLEGVPDPKIFTIIAKAAKAMLFSVLSNLTLGKI